MYIFKKKQNWSHQDYKFISILLCVFDINQNTRNINRLFQILWIK